jgi:hypothetical protein
MCEPSSSRSRRESLATRGTSRALDLISTIAAGPCSDTQPPAGRCALRTISLSDRAPPAKAWRRGDRPRSPAGLSKCRRTFSVRREPVAIAGHRDGGVGELDRRDMDEIAPHQKRLPEKTPM